MNIVDQRKPSPIRYLHVCIDESSLFTDTPKRIKAKNQAL